MTDPEYPKDRDLSGLVRYEQRMSHPQRPPSTLSDVSSISLGHVNPAFAADNASVTGSRVSVASSSLGIRSNTPVVLTRTDGSKVIITPNRDHRDLSMEEPELKEKKVTVMKYLAIAALFLFFPTAIPAVIYSRRTETEFFKGFQSGDRETARKYAKWTEWLLILSLICGILLWAIIGVIIERVNSWDDDREHHVGIL